METLKITYTHAAAVQKRSLEEEMERSKQFEEELAEIRPKLHTALNLIKVSEGDVARAAAAEQKMQLLTEELERFQDDAKLAREEKDAVVQTNKILVEELTEQLLISTRRCEDMDEDVKTLQSYAAEVSSCQERVCELTLQLKASEGKREEMEELMCMQENELEDLRELHDSYDQVKLEMQNKLSESQNHCAVAESELYKLRVALEGKSVELTVLTENHLNASKDRDVFQREVEKLSKEYLELKHEYESASESLSQTEKSLQEARENILTVVGKCEKLEKAIAEKDVVNDVLRAQNATLTTNIREAEFELNGTSAKLLEATRSQEQLETQIATLNVDCNAKRCEIDELQQRLSAVDAMVKNMVDKSEAARAVNIVKVELEGTVNQLESRIDTLEKNKEELLGDIDACITVVCQCGHAVDTLLSVHGSSSPHRSVWEDRLGKSDGGGLSSILVNLLSELETNVEALCKSNESLSRTIAGTCVYMLRGRKTGHVNSAENHDHDFSIDSSSSDDTPGKESMLRILCTVFVIVATLTTCL